MQELNNSLNVSVFLFKIARAITLKVLETIVIKQYAQTCCVVSHSLFSL